VVCGAVELVAGRPDTATNPTLLVEVLSDATRDCDRGEKFALYKGIPTLAEYLTIEQGMPRVEHWQRGQRGGWKATLHTRRNAVVRLRAGAVALALADVYRDALA
jgi:Uma2 family endonuclease